ncbi:Xaa-Pro peptidase family protein [Mechercharimyces sp. CAU 1602]|uniref:M24 family metallopeptidase n=1 Tax=Mechercharimyces sp. CAU 1602 TaxID=2973933 RepID=UPI002163471A|nr:Xaa-Pro peptidase family protein [Mechercharimyces sp. CAU 1602]MCS1350758.1 Xaa-Pro peptidase family protein [Mechercharimyces sp. CAU 1602]
MERRIARLRHLMDERGIEAMLISHPIHRQYISGFTGSAGLVFISSEVQLLLTDFRYVSQAKEEAPQMTLVEMERQAYHTVSEQCDQFGIKTLHFEQDHLTYRQATELKAALKSTTLHPANQVVEKLREIKEETELKVMRQAAKIADDAYAQIIKEVRPGKTEREIALRLEFMMREMGATSSSFDMIVASGVRSAMPHGVATDKVMENGDMVTIDFGALYQGYCSDMTRTFMLGEPSEKQNEIYHIVLEAQQKALEAIAPGVKACEIDKVARDVITARGYGDAFGHSTGHGLGMEVHESPGISARTITELQPGMVITVEPGIYLPDVAGVRIEDDVIVTETGYELLTHTPKELVIVK